jgi:ferrous iron transport protein A
LLFAARLANANHAEEVTMMPLLFANPGEENIIKKIGGNPEIKRHLENLGFVVGGGVTIVTENNGNVIVNVKETRVAVSREMAQKIMI